MSVPKSTTEQMKLSQKEEGKRLNEYRADFGTRWEARLIIREVNDKRNGHYE